MKNLKTAVVTGAAGDIGSEVSRLLDQMGYSLLLVDIDQQRLQELAHGFKNAIALRVDLTNREELSELQMNIKQEYGKIDVAFINAGMIVVGKVTELSEAQIDLQLELNLRSAMMLIKACAENMKEHEAGHIISTISMGGIVALKGSATYSATKFGLRGFMSGIRDELKPHGIEVSGIFPSGVDTQLLRYEAKNGGSALNFVSTPQAVETIGKVFLKALKTKRLEYYVPFSDGLSGRLLSTIPWVIRYLYPVLEWLGEKGRIKYLKTFSD